MGGQIESGIVRGGTASETGGVSPRRGRGRPVNREEHEAKRQALLNAALRLFCEKGYFQVSVNEISRSSGQTKGAFYWYFDSKDDCLEQVLDRGMQDLNRGIDRVEATYKTPREQLYYLTDVSPWMKEGFQQFLRLLTGLVDAGRHRLQDHARGRAVQTLTAARRRVRGVFERVMAETGQKGFDPDILAACLIAAFDGLLSHFRLAPNYADPGALTSTLRELFYRRFYAG
jgi:AcrR family transcriptional regulator